VKISKRAYGPEPDQYVEHYLPAEPTGPGTVLIIHGGFWRPEFDASLGRPLALDLAQRGYTVANLEYRRPPRDGWRSISTDVRAAVTTLTGTVVAVGHSAGGQLAVYAAQYGRLAGVVTQAGLLDLVTAAENRVGGRSVEKLLGGTPQEVPERYGKADPIALLPSRVPVVCVHSRADEWVPFAQSEAYAEKSGAELIEVPGDHLAHVQPATEAWAAVLDVLPRLLSRPS
jgi:acetyl esterase/lipase